MDKEENIEIVLSNLREQLRKLDDHTIVTIILAPPEGAPADAES